MEREQILTELEQKILNFIGQYLRENEGRSPTLAEIGFGCGIKSSGTIHRYVTSIQEKGFLSKARAGWRTIQSKNELPYKGVIAAGKPIEAIEQSEFIDIVSELIQPDCFVLEVSGESMIDLGILNGDKVIIRPAATARNGQIVVALIDNENASLKEYRSLEGENVIQLIPHNKGMKVQTYTSDRVVIQGVLSSVVRTYQ